MMEWVSHLRPEKQDDFKDMIFSSSKVLERLKQMVEGRMIQLDNPENIDFGSPAWAEKVAYDLGRRKVLNDMIKLLTL